MGTCWHSVGRVTRVMWSTSAVNIFVFRSRKRHSFSGSPSTSVLRPHWRAAMGDKRHSDSSDSDGSSDRDKRSKRHKEHKDKKRHKKDKKVGGPYGDVHSQSDANHRHCRARNPRTTSCSRRPRSFSKRVCSLLHLMMMFGTNACHHRARRGRSCGHHPRPCQRRQRVRTHPSLLPQPQPPQIVQISADDYFAKNAEFSTWLLEAKQRYFSDLSTEESRALFDNDFVPAWNAGLPRMVAVMLVVSWACAGQPAAYVHS